MARGNQRDKAREKNQKAAAGTVRQNIVTTWTPSHKQQERNFLNEPSNHKWADRGEKTR
jgi:hypothetical protein